MARPPIRLHSQRRSKMLYLVALIIGAFFFFTFFSHEKVPEQETAIETIHTGINWEDDKPNHPIVKAPDSVDNTVPELEIASVLVNRRDLVVEKPQQQQQQHFEPEPQKRVVTSEAVHLVIAIPTIARSGAGKDYLKTTVQHLYTELQAYKNSRPGANRSVIKVLVQKNNPNEVHSAFDEIKNDPKYASDFIFHVNQPRFDDPFEDIPGYDYKAPDNVQPGHIARQQNCDIVSLMDNSIALFPNYEYFMFMEDDFIMCDGSIETTLTAIESAKHRNPNFCGVRVSYGMNGLVMPRNDIAAFSSYTRGAIKELPIDLLIREYMFAPGKSFSCKANGRDLYVYKTVQSEHIGEISTFIERNNPTFRPRFPSCGESMIRVWSLDERERFSHMCMDKPDGLSPC